jgi:hypothetical protein
LIGEKFKDTIENLDKLGLEINLKERMKNPYLPITQVQDRDFPPKEARRYDNYLIAVLDVKAKNGIMYNFVFKDGATSQVKISQEQEEVRL